MRSINALGTLGRITEIPSGAIYLLLFSPSICAARAAESPVKISLRSLRDLVSFKATFVFISFANLGCTLDDLIRLNKFIPVSFFLDLCLSLSVDSRYIFIQ